MRELHPVSGLFPALGADEEASLEASIRAHGVLVPIAVDSEGRVVDGRHRAAIADRLAVDCPEAVVDLDPWQYARTVNLDRRNLTAQQRVAVVLRAEQEGLAPEVTAIRQAAAERQSPGQGGIADQQSRDSGRARDQIGALVGASGATVERVQEAVEAAGPEALVRIEAGRTTAQEELRAVAAKGMREHFPAPTPVFDAWWKACGLLMRKVRPDTMEEEWGPDDRQKVLEWTSRLIDRLREVERVAGERPALVAVGAGSGAGRPVDVVIAEGYDGSGAGGLAPWTARAINLVRDAPLRLEVVLAECMPLIHPGRAHRVAERARGTTERSRSLDVDNDQIIAVGQRRVVYRSIARNRHLRVTGRGADRVVEYVP